MSKIIKLPEQAFSNICSYEHELLTEAVPESDQSEQGPEIDREEIERITREEIMEQVRAEAEQKVKEAYAEGLQRGMAAGKEKFDESIAESAQALSSAADAVRQARAEFLATIEAQVVKLSGVIAAQVLKREVKGDPDFIKSTVRHVLEGMAERERVRLKVNTADLYALREHKVTLLEEFDGIEHLEIIADDSISPGGCMAESETCFVDGQIETQLERILDSIEE